MSLFSQEEIDWMEDRQQEIESKGFWDLSLLASSWGGEEFGLKLSLSKEIIKNNMAGLHFIKTKDGLNNHCPAISLVCSGSKTEILSTSDSLSLDCSITYKDLCEVLVIDLIDGFTVGISKHWPLEADIYFKKFLTEKLLKEGVDLKLTRGMENWIID